MGPLVDSSCLSRTARAGGGSVTLAGMPTYLILALRAGVQEADIWSLEKGAEERNLQCWQVTLPPSKSTQISRIMIITSGDRQQCMADYKRKIMIERRNFNPKTRTSR